VPTPTETKKDGRQADRYEPLPGIVHLPTWLWERMGRGTRIALLVAVLATVGGLAVAVPGMLESKEERAEAERRERAERRAELIRGLEREQRPRFRRFPRVAPPGAAPEEQLAGRAALMEALAAEILADARERVRRGQLDGPIRRVECEPFPRSVDGVGADEDLSRPVGRYSCVAVTAEFGESEQVIEGIIGHNYRTEVDFRSGRYAFCKVAGQSGPSREQLVTTPRVCGG
jgi:hypothetical protein